MSTLSAEYSTSQIREESFAENVKICERLELQGNLLKSFDLGHLADLPELEYLDLSGEYAKVDVILPHFIHFNDWVTYLNVQ